MPNAEPGADWAPAAELDVDEIWDYYAETASSETAGRLLASIFAVVSRVAAHPLQGRSRTDIRRDLRSVRAPPYLVFYRVRSGRVQILRVLHERRDVEKLLAENPQ